MGSRERRCPSPGRTGHGEHTGSCRYEERTTISGQGGSDMKRCIVFILSVVVGCQVSTNAFATDDSRPTGTAIEQVSVAGDDSIPATLPEEPADQSPPPEAGLAPVPESVTAPEVAPAPEPEPVSEPEPVQAPAVEPAPAPYPEPLPEPAPDADVTGS